MQPNQGSDGEKRPGRDAPLARAITSLLLYLVSMFYLPNTGSLLMGLLMSVTRVSLFLAACFSFMRRLTLGALRYELGDSAVVIRFSIHSLNLPYASVAAVEHQDTPWPIKKASFLTYAKEVPQLIEYVAQVGPFIVNGRGKVYLYSTLTSYHHPKGLILITTTEGKTYGVSPAEPERFVEELEQRRRQVLPQ